MSFAQDALKRVQSDQWYRRWVSSASLHLAARFVRERERRRGRLRVGDAAGVDGVPGRSDRPFMVKIEIEYNGQLQTEALHGQIGRAHV